MSKIKSFLQSHLADKVVQKEDLRNLKGGGLHKDAKKYGLDPDDYADKDALKAAIKVMKLESKLCKKANLILAQVERAHSNGDGVW